MDSDNFLTRAQVDEIVEHMTARDLFSASPATPDVKGNEVASRVFEVAAERQGFGELALDRVKPKDAVYLAQKLGEVFDSEAPKDGDTVQSQDSSDTGGSVQSS